MLLQPYPGKNISEEDAIFNYHVSQVRLVIEKYFGIIARSWRIFLQTIQSNAESGNAILRAAISLHNYLRQTNSAAYCPNPLLTIMIAQVKSKKVNGKHW